MHSVDLQNGSESKGCLTLYSKITPYDIFEISRIESIMENGAFAIGANAPFSIIFSKVFMT